MTDTNTKAKEPVLDIVYVEDIAFLFDATAATVKGWVRSGKLPRLRKIGRRRYWLRSEIKLALESLTPRVDSEQERNRRHAAGLAAASGARRPRGKHSRRNGSTSSTAAASGAREGHGARTE